MFKSLLTSIFLVILALPVTAQVGPGRGPTDYNPNYDARRSSGRVCTRSARGRLSLRTGPGTGYYKVKEIPNGHLVALRDGQYGNDGFYWWYVTHNGSDGWVRSDYVCGDPQ